MLKIETKKIENTDITFFKKYYDTSKMTHLSQERSGQVSEHYKLLTYLSNQIDNVKILDAGTHYGCSCLALAQNKNNIIYTYDNMDYMPDKNYQLPFKSDYDNVIYIKENVFNLSIEEFKEFEIILLDTNHYGPEEIEFYKLLIDNNYEGYLILDDIFSPTHPNMLKFWNSIDKPKYDLTSVGHCTGTGVVCFNRDINIV